jgi:hypothetical protein
MIDKLKSLYNKIGNPHYQTNLTSKTSQINPNLLIQTFLKTKFATQSKPSKRLILLYSI